MTFEALPATDCRLDPFGMRPALRVYLLGVTDYSAALELQHRLVDEVAAGGAPALVLCEHSPCITVGRQGSAVHIDLDIYQPPRWATYWATPWSVRWVNRGGGCWVHGPGQLAIYPVLPLQRLGLALPQYRAELLDVLRLVSAEYGVFGAVKDGQLFVGQRPLACFGAAIRDWVTYHGAILNVSPDLTPFRHVRTGESDARMTSIQRECRRPFRLSQVRECVVETFANTLGFGDVICFTSHPLLTRGSRADAAVAAC
jgi:lipoyl(octanoyl) transferase